MGARPKDAGHPQFRLLRKVQGKSVAESFATPVAFRKAAQEVTEFHRFQDLTAELTALNEEIWRLRPAQPDETGWTEVERERRRRLFIKKSHGKSRRCSTWCFRPSGKATVSIWNPSRWPLALACIGPEQPC